MSGFYDLKLVALSLIIAIIASYTTLEQAGHQVLSAEGGAEGFDGYLEKPIRYKEFQASVAELLAGKSQ